MEALRSVSQATRRFVRTPGFTLACVLTLAIGIGANAAIFSVIHGVLIKPLPYPEPERLVGLWNKAPGLGFDQLNQTAALYLTYLDEARSFEDIAMWDNRQVSVSGGEQPEEVRALLVTEAFFRILGATPALGRFFSVEDDSPDSVETIVLGYDYWTTRFGQSTDVLGTTLNIGGRPREVIGVTPRGFRFLQRNPAIYYPARFDRNEVVFGQFNYQMFGRTRGEADLAAIEAELAPLIPVATERFADGVPLEMLQEAQFAPVMTSLKTDAVGDVGRVLWILMGTVGLVLLIACANVANLFLVRAESQRRELALRTALGSSRGQIARYTLLESCLLALVAGALGLGLARLGLAGLVRIEPGNLPRIHEISITPSEVLFTVGIAVATGLLFGSFALLRTARVDLSSALKDGGRTASGAISSHRTRHALVVVQVGLALVLLVGSGLMIRSFLELRSVSPGFQDPESVLTFRLSLPSSVEPDPLRVEQFWERSLSELSALPGVTDATASFSLPMDGFDSNDPLYVEGFEPPENQLPPIRRFKWVSPRYPETLRNPVLAGRSIEAADIHERRNVVVITRNFALEYWDSPAEAIGKRVRNASIIDNEVPWLEIVGVVSDVYDDGPDQPPVSIAYFPVAMNHMWGEDDFVNRSMAFALRTELAEPSSLLPAVQRIIWAQNPNLPIANVRTLEDIAADRLARTSFTVVMLLVAAIVALLLGSVGIYAVLAYIVSLRTREIGVRMALGARRRQVMTMILRYGLVLTAIGVVVGLLSSLVLTRLMTSLLFGVEATDPSTYLGVTLLLLVAAVAACLMVSSRATRVDPMRVLRAD